MRSVVVLARAPSPPGKTRLTADLSVDRARALREALLLDTLDVARATGENIIVSFTPDAARDEMASLVGSIDLIAQRGGDLGERMYCAMSDAFMRGAKSVVLLGSDLPLLPPERITEAFAMLESGADVVFGPSTDGGFYLVAARDAPPDVFFGIEWSTDHVLTDVIAIASGKGLTVGLLDACWDVDCPEDLLRVTTDTRPDTAVRVRRWCASDTSLG